MKALIFSLLMISSTAFAFEVPKDAVIKVYTKDGKQIGEMSRSEYKVVKLEEKKPYHSAKEIKQMAEAMDYKEGHFSVILQGGIGQDGLRHTYDNNVYRVTDRIRPVIGATLCYTKNTVGVCASGISNKTGMLGIKKDFN